MTGRKLPNILVTGTPGVGKSTLCEQLASEYSAGDALKWINVGKLAEQHDCFLDNEYDHEYQCPVLDEDKLLDEMESIMSAGGAVVDYHSSEMFPRRWFDIVFVLRTDNTVLYDRLHKRGYTGRKLEDNLQCEIFQTLLDEARESYDTGIVHELLSNTPEQMANNVDMICRWVDSWKQSNAASHCTPG